ncbi:MAG TPA: IS66 family transposase [Thermoanaerobaculia bacterium]|jgi:transposase|nr:IS66 family transposase [Thermoanaerobaculia bacterium]
MNLDPNQLPDDPTLLRGVISQLLGAMERLERKNAWLQAEVEALFRKLFRKRSEKLDPRQLELVFEAMRDLGISQHQLEQLELEVTVPPRQRRGAPTRQPLAKDLPRERVEHALPESERCCKACGLELTRIREEVTEQLDYTPASFKIIEHVRGVFACKGCEETITRAPKAPQPIAKGLPGPGLLAQVTVSKYSDHQPLYRQAQIYARHGVILSRSTLCGWVADAAELVGPLVEWMRCDLLRSRIVQTDDTPVTVLDDQGGTHKGRLWVYLGDRGHPQVVYDYTPTREARGPTQFLDGFRGYLQADAYSGYDALYASGAVIEVGCWAHARRYFHEAAFGAGDTRGHAALAFIHQLFAVERAATDQQLSFEQRQARRQEASRKTLDAFTLWLEDLAPQVLPKSALAAAIGYTQRQWSALERYLGDGELLPDNSASERALRAVAIGRKNWLFAGSDAGGVRAARLYSLIASCKRHGLEPYAYLRSLFARLPSHPVDRLFELTPVAWAAAHPTPR